MSMRRGKRIVWAMAIGSAIGAADAAASVVAMRSLVLTDPSIAHLYTFEGATTADRQLDKVGSLNLSVSSYGSGTSISYSTGFDGTTTAFFPGVTATSGTALKSGSTTLSTTLTIEALIRPDGSVGAANQYAVSSGGSPTRGYFLLQREGDLKTGVGSGAFSDGAALRDYASNYVTGNWYYVVGTFTTSGSNTVFNSWVANLSAPAPTLVQTNTNAAITGNFATSANLGIGMFDSGATEAFKGGIDEVAIYNTALSTAAVTRHFYALTRPSQVIYREIFPNDDGVDAALGETGWKVNVGSTGASAPTYTGSSPITDPRLSFANGVPTTAEPINSFPANAELVRGFMFDNDTSATPHLLWTNEVNVNLSDYLITKINWQQYTNASNAVRVALLIDGVWYASDATFTQTGSFALKSLDLLSATWRSLSFTENTVLSLGSSTTLTGTTLQGIGFYVDNPTDRLRFDTVEIEAISLVPTPAALPAGLTLLGAHLMRRRR
ncbi:MAG: hypothetical protein GC162_19510 [Planctomycetes bacterium]|nr:hypothetical protein [Planctomycetota bacterium]